MELLKAMKEMMDASQAKMLAEMKQEIRAGQEHLKEEMKAHLEEVTARLEAIQDKMETNQAKMDMQEKMEAAIHSMWSELEDTIKYRMEDIQSCVNQEMQGLHKELIEQFEVLPYKLPLSLYICQI
jgi:predicted  nucleic acid-binding Zn-ribbon protein